MRIVHILIYPSFLRLCLYHTIIMPISAIFHCFNSLPASVVGLDPDQARQKVGPDLDPNCLTL